MTKNNKPEIEIGVKYDGKGADEAKKSLESVQHKAEDVGRTPLSNIEKLDEIFGSAAEGAGEYKEELEKAGEAAREEGAREKALELQMELATKTRRELAGEVRRLAAARRESSKAGDVKQVQALNEQYRIAKTALRDMNQQAALNKAAMMGQAVAGMNMAQNLAGLAEQAKSGSTNIAGLANQVLSLGMALKAGMGPVGVIMAGLQAAQMAFDAWLDKRKKAVEEEIKANEEATARIKKMWEESAAAAKWENTQDIKDREEAIKIWSEVEEKEMEKQRRLLKEKNKEEEEADARASIAAQKRYELEKSRIEARREAGMLAEKEARMSLEKAEEEWRAEKARLELKKQQRELESAKNEASITKNLADTFAQQVERQFGSEEMKKVLTVSLPDEGELKALQLRINNAADKAEEARLEKKKAEFDDALATVAAAMRAMGISTDGGQEAVEAWAREAQKTYKEQKKIAESKNKEAEEAAAHVGEVEASMETARERRAAEEEQAKAARQLAEITDKKAAREKEWVEVQRKEIWEQKAWLEKTKNSLAEGSREWEKWNEESRKLSTKGVKVELQKIKENYARAEKQAEENNLTEAEKIAVNNQVLKETERQLQALLASPDIDAGTRRDINLELVNTRRQLLSLSRKVERGAVEAQKALENFQMPNLKAKSKAHEKALDNLKRYMEAEVKRAEAAASRGDAAAVERYKKSLAQLALRIEGCVGYTGQGEALYREIVSQLSIQVAGYKDENKGLNSRQIAQRDITARLKEAAKSNSEFATNSKGLAKTVEDAHKGSVKAKKGQEEVAAQNEKTAEEARQLEQETHAAVEAAKKVTRQTNAAAEAMSHAADQKSDSAADAPELRQQVAQMSAAVEATRALLAEVGGGMEAWTKGMAEQQQELLNIKGELENMGSVQSLALGVMRGMAEQLSRSLTQTKKELDTLREEFKRLKKL